MYGIRETNGFRHGFVYRQTTHVGRSVKKMQNLREKNGLLRLNSNYSMRPKQYEYGGIKTLTIKWYRERIKKEIKNSFLAPYSN